MKSRLLSPLAVSLLLLFLIVPPVARAQSPSSRITEDLTSADTSAAFADANAIILESAEEIEFKSSGSYKERMYGRIQILTDKGREDYGQITFDYHRRYGEIDVRWARIHKTDGRVIEVPEGNISDISSSATAGMDIYEPDFREKLITFPNLEIGDTIEYEVRISYKPLIKNHFNMEFFFQYFDPIKYKKVVITGPKSMPLNYIVRNGELKLQKTEKGSKAIYQWEVHDAERIIPEPAMVSFTSVATRLVVNTQNSWQEMSSYVFSLMEKKLKADKSVKKKVAEITEGLSTDQEKIREVHYFIAKNIRYLGVAMDRKAFIEPHEASYTLERGCGVCRDKAVLMVSMLSELGIEAYVVLINIYRDTIEDIPSLFFEHAIVAVVDADGLLHYMDPTDEFSAGVKATYAGEKSVLICSKDGEDLTQIPFVPAEENLGSIRASSVVRDDGSVESTVTVTGAGIYEEMLRGVASRMVESELEVIWETLLQDVYPGAEVTRMELGDPTDLRTPMYMKFNYKIEDYVLDVGTYWLFKAPMATGGFDLVSRSLGRVADLPERKYGMFIGATIGVEEKETLTLPSGYHVRSTPDDMSAERGQTSLTMSYETSAVTGSSGESTLTYRKKLLINSSILSPDEYLQFKELLKLVGKSQKGEIILTKEEI